MGLVPQEDFAGGIFRSPRAPAGSVYDAIDGLVDDERAIYKRGGSVYKTTSDVPSWPLRGIASETLTGGSRTVFWTSNGDVYRLDLGAGVAPIAIPSLFELPRDYARMHGVAGMMAVISRTEPTVWLYGGSTMAAAYSTGTAGVTLGSTAVTGAGTAWLANVDPGMIFQQGGNHNVVAKVTSNTALTLFTPFAGATNAAAAYSLRPVDATVPPILLGSAPAVEAHAASVGSPARLVITANNRAYFSAPGLPWTFDQTDYHEIPAGMITGADSVRDLLVLFSTVGVWLVSNMNLDLTDAAGDPQQQMSQISKDVILWDDAGVAGLSTYAGILGWNGQMIVPALDDVYMLGADSSVVSLSRGIRPLYHSYVAAGYRLGTATIYRGHYFLPIRDVGGSLIDTLVCRLDQRDSRGQLRPAWTRFSNAARPAAFAGRVRPGLAPDLFGVKGQRVLDLTGVFTPTAATKIDADGTTHNLDVTTNDLEPGQLATLERVRLGYELTDAASDNPTIAASYSTGPEGSAFTALSGTAAENDGTAPKTWRVTKRARRFRLRFLSSGPSSKLRIRFLWWFVRDSDRP